MAIKRLQGDGLSLDEIAERLGALDAAGLEALAAVPPASLPADLGDVAPDDRRPARRSGQFWASGSAPPASTPATPPAPARNFVAGEPGTPIPLVAVALSAEVTLLVSAHPGLLPAPARLRAAASPLLDLLSPRPAPDDRPRPRKDP